ncbi:MAG: DUF1552 domain-containing protein [Myxococcota bacterium]|nr:DUF1552 domain-containing protein [Myxococcota bacterium]
MRLHRRQILKLGAGAFALPLLQLPRQARAQGAAEFPTRLIIFYQPNGTKKELWSPADDATENRFAMGPLLHPLSAHQDKLVLFDGLNMEIAGQGPGGPHQRGMASVLTGAEINSGDFVGGDGRRAGWASGPSIDQFAAAQLQPATPLTTLELGVRVKQAIPRTRIIYRGADQPIPPENDPVAAYQRVFGQFDGDEDQQASQRRILRRRSILDFVRADFEKLRRRVTAEDARKLEQHAESLRDLERRLGVIAERHIGQCSPDRPMSVDVLDENLYRDLLRAQIDIMVAGMSCDVTRFGSIQCSESVNALRFTFMGLNQHEGHSLSHSGDSNVAMQTQWDQMLVWYSEQLAYLLERLAAVPEGPGTMLDNTLVFAINEISRGNTHSHTDMPFILAGGAGGRLPTGRYLTYDGVSHTELLVAILNLLGIPVDSFGDPRFCRGPLPGLV